MTQEVEKYQENAPHHARLKTEKKRKIYAVEWITPQIYPTKKIMNPKKGIKVPAPEEKKQSVTRPSRNHNNVYHGPISLLRGIVLFLPDPTQARISR